MAEREVAIVVGVGPGLGTALARRLSRANMSVAVAARDTAPLERMAADLQRYGGRGRAYGCDATEEEQVEELFAKVKTELGEPNLVVYNAGAFVPRGILETEAREFERCWRVGCLGGFLVGRAAARLMAARGSGTIVFTGATASLRGGAGFVNLAVGKFGLRAVAQSMARELGPRGVHVAHVIIDGQIMAPHHEETAAERGPDSLLAPDAIAETFFQLHRQQRSAWTHELDLRPWVERF